MEIHDHWLVGNNTETGIYFPPFSIVPILCKSYAQLHQQLAVAQLYNETSLLSEYILSSPWPFVILTEDFHCIFTVKRKFLTSMVRKTSKLLKTLFNC